MVAKIMYKFDFISSVRDRLAVVSLQLTTLAPEDIFVFVRNMWVAIEILARTNERSVIGFYEVSEKQKAKDIRALTKEYRILTN
jgi:hypothetical protein